MSFGDAPFSLRNFQALAAEMMAEDPTLGSALEDDGPPATTAGGPPARTSSAADSSPSRARPTGLHVRMPSSDMSNLVDSLEYTPDAAKSGISASSSVTASGSGPNNRPATAASKLLGASRLERTASSSFGSKGGGGGQPGLPTPSSRPSTAASPSLTNSRSLERAGGSALGERVREGSALSGVDGPTPPASQRRQMSRSGSASEMDKGGSRGEDPLRTPGAESPKAPAARGGGGRGVEGLNLDGGKVQQLLQDPNDRSYFLKAEEMYSLQLAVALRLIADSELAEETEMALPQADPSSVLPSDDMLWTTPSLPRTQAEATAYRFWVNGCLSSEDRIEDGFYDIWGMQPHVYSLCAEPSQRGRMPPMDALRALTPSEATFDVTVVHREKDRELKMLEEKAVELAYAADEVQALAQKLGALVAQHLGGAVASEPDDLVPRYRQRGWEIKTYLKTIVLPLGRLPVGLCRHRALLFKVLADAAAIPCRIQRGCRFCGMDDGASCVVLASGEKEYIVDVVHKPGTLIPMDPLASHSNLPASLTNAAIAPAQILSPLRSFNVKTLALTDPADGSAPSWIPDFRRSDDDSDIPEGLGSRRIRAASPGGASPRGPRRGRNFADDDEEEEAAAAKKGQKQRLPRSATEEKRGPPLKGSDVPPPLPMKEGPEADGELGAELMDVLTADGRIMEIGEAEIDWNDIELGERVGAGTFGTVYRGEWASCDVAVKVLINQDLQEEQLLEFKREVAIMRRMRHPNIVLFMGAVTKPPNLSIITEFLARGSLFRLLHRPGAKESLKEDRRLRMAMDIARGINYLHHCTPMIVHRDLKSPNLLVDKNFTVKVCDFGLSRNKNSTFLSSKSGAGTPEWMAPEVLRNEPSDEKSDVYSFGVILWEIATLQQPWDGMNQMQVVGAVGFQNQRLTIPDDLNPELRTLISDCWIDDPKKRPGISQIMTRLKPLYQKAAGAGGGKHAEKD